VQSTVRHALSALAEGRANDCVSPTIEACISGPTETRIISCTALGLINNGKRTTCPW
jgi:hypothetical protein